MCENGITAYLTLKDLAAVSVNTNTANFAKLLLRPAPEDYNNDSGWFF